MHSKKLPWAKDRLSAARRSGGDCGCAAGFHELRAKDPISLEEIFRYWLILRVKDNLWGRRRENAPLQMPK